MTRIALVLALMAAPAFAQDSAATVTPCGDATRADTIAEPWEDNSRTFSNGAVRIAKLDVGEPAFGGFFLLVLSPPYGELGERQCRVLTLPETSGFAGIDFDRLEAAYDPSVGLMFTVPVRVFAMTDTVEPVGAMLKFSLNQATGAISPRLELGD